jgi:hypothetical protein
MIHHTAECRPIDIRGFDFSSFTVSKSVDRLQPFLVKLSDIIREDLNNSQKSQTQSLANNSGLTLWVQRLHRKFGQRRTLDSSSIVIA